MVLTTAFCLILIHFLIPIIRIKNLFSVSYITTISSGFAISHWIMFGPPWIYGYASLLSNKFYPHISIRFFIFMLFLVTLLGFISLLALDTIVFRKRLKGLKSPMYLYYFKLLTIFGFNFSASHYIPISAYKNSKEIFIYFVDAVVNYILSDFSINKTFPNRYKISSRLLAMLGVMSGTIVGHFGINHENDWFMGYIDSFLAGCSLFLIAKAEFTTDTTERHFGIFIASAIIMVCFIYLYQFT